jgi:addiction module RelE/StbE family toxin
MAKEIIWSFRAIQDRKEIYTYWNHRNKSDNYSKKLDFLFQKMLELISINPKLGRPTNRNNFRVKTVRDYLLIYEVRSKEIVLITIWDSRRNPQKLQI